ncbi:putative membrane-associated kinase regulator 4 [Nicotiana tabacum]|uniref:Membrane-associated kinase regulator 4 n=1 Tax=Nicotiana tabacum TaxID=4097 RepID=A0A1S4B5U8_TOBAC|nr:probable membrane-associated kinase regulator 4 [Nicotiana tomentosiformis]XP_016484222.1 PREDICTED: probable membrane-associated kinase regulator 4 [Nicotiana tabacum]
MEYEEIRRSCDNAEEDYIDMEVSSHSNIFSHFKNSPSQAREFEFQMLPNSIDKDTTTSPADELFHNGKLLPLHLPFGTQQMVEKLLQNPNKSVHGTTKVDIFEESSFSTPLFTTTTNTPTNNTPFESCNISPSDSCQVSRELNPNEYLFEYSTEDHVNSFNPVDENSKRSWTRKLKLIKNSSFGSKLKSSRAYVKSFFSKSGCSNEYSANFDKGSVPMAKEHSYNVKEGKKEPFGKTQRGVYSKGMNKENVVDQDLKGRHRRSFSGAIKRFSTAKSCSSSSFTSSSGSSSASSSNNSNEFQDMHFFKRSSSAYSEIENSIQAAIAHCKNSQQQFHSRKTISDIGVCSLSASKVISEEQERPGLCTG